MTVSAPEKHVSFHTSVFLYKGEIPDDEIDPQEYHALNDGQKEAVFQALIQASRFFEAEESARSISDNVTKKRVYSILCSKLDLSGDLSTALRIPDSISPEEKDKTYERIAKSFASMKETINAEKIASLIVDPLKKSAAHIAICHAYITQKDMAKAEAVVEEHIDQKDKDDSYGIIAIGYSNQGDTVNVERILQKILDGDKREITRKKIFQGLSKSVYEPDAEKFIALLRKYEEREDVHQVICKAYIERKDFPNAEKVAALISDETKRNEAYRDICLNLCREGSADCFLSIERILGFMSVSEVRDFTSERICSILAEKGDLNGAKKIALFISNSDCKDAVYQGMSRLFVDFLISSNILELSGVEELPDLMIALKAKEFAFYDIFRFLAHQKELANAELWAAKITNPEIRGAAYIEICAKLVEKEELIELQKVFPLITHRGSELKACLRISQAFADIGKIAAAKEWASKVSDLEKRSSAYSHICLKLAEQGRVAELKKTFEFVTNIWEKKNKYKECSFIFVNQGNLISAKTYADLFCSCTSSFANPQEKVHLYKVICNRCIELKNLEGLKEFLSILPKEQLNSLPIETGDSVLSEMIGSLTVNIFETFSKCSQYRDL